MAKPSKTEVVVEEVVAPVAVVEEQPAAPSLVDSIAAIDEQIANPKTMSMVKDALLKARQHLIRQQIKQLQAEVRALQALMPKRQKRNA